MNYQGPNDYGVAPNSHPAGSLPHIFQLVEGLAKKLQNLQRQTVSAVGLTPQQYVMLGALAEQDKRPLKELAQIAQCTPATITGIVDVLERKELVTRQPNPHDRRSLLVALTPKGRMTQASTPHLEEMFHGCCTGLHPDQAAQLTQLLSQLDQSLDAWEPTT